MSKIVVDGIELDLTVGCDPEVFVTDKGGKLVSAHNMVPGTKDSPSPVKCGGIQVDGMALEFNIEPAQSKAEFISNTQVVMGELLKALPSGHDLKICSTAQFGKAYIDEQPEAATDLGCSPDFNAYMSGEQNPKPNGQLPFRTAAGHIHVGWTESGDTKDQEHQHYCQQVVQVMDLLLGVPSVLMDSDKQRRSMYGMAGSYRAKTYGVEYRVLSNFWLKNQHYMAWAYEQTELAVKKVLGGFSVPDTKEVQRIINSSDIKGAKSLIQQFNIQTPETFTYAN